MLNGIRLGIWGLDWAFNYNQCYICWIYCFPSGLCSKDWALESGSGLYDHDFRQKNELQLLDHEPLDCLYWPLDWDVSRTLRPLSVVLQSIPQSVSVTTALPPFALGKNWTATLNQCFCCSLLEVRKKLSRCLLLRVLGCHCRRLF